MSDIACQCGEGAVWSLETGTLLYIDIPGRTVHEYDPQGPSRSWLLDSPVGCIAVHESGSIVVALPDGFHLLDPQSGDVSPICLLDDPDPSQRFNDGAVDSVGRFWVGTMLTSALKPEEIGRVWRLGHGEINGPFFDPLYTPNGMTFSPDGKRMYLSDSYPDRQIIWVFDYDPDTGEPSNGRTFVDMHPMAGRPDGAAMDSEGCYWIACLEGREIASFDPTGRLDRLIPVPLGKPTKVAFGGSDMKTLYVTSMAGYGEPLDGRLFAIDVDVPGVPVSVVVGPDESPGGPYRSHGGKVGPASGG